MADWLDLALDVPLGGSRLEVCVATDARSVGIVGPSGGGKSTLLRVLAGVERGAAGRVSVLGEVWQEPGRFTPPWLRRVGWVPQDAALFPHLDVRGNLTYAGAAGLTEVVELLDIPTLLDRQPRNLSGGERQRVALGRALLSNPRLLLLDEPFAALDRPLRARLATRLAAWCDARDLRVILVTHDERDLLAANAECWEISGGRLGRTSA